MSPLCLTPQARPIALARRSSHNHLPGFVVGTKCVHQLPQAMFESCSDRQRLQRAPLRQQSCQTRAVADFTSAPLAANAWRSSNGGLRLGQRRQRRIFCGDARAPSSISGSRHSCDGSPGDSAGGDDDLSAAILELEPLVERVASALEQRCGVRGGDLVRVFWDRFHAVREMDNRNCGSRPISRPSSCTLFPKCM